MNSDKASKKGKADTKDTVTQITVKDELKDHMITASGSRDHIRGSYAQSSHITPSWCMLMFLQTEWRVIPMVEES